MNRPGMAAIVLSIVAVAGVLPGGAPAAEPGSAAEALTVLNAQRQANGIPGNLTVDERLSRGCRLHNVYLRRTDPEKTRGLDAHDELSSEPAYTELGAEAGASSSLGGLVYEDRWRHDINPWIDTPLHQLPFMNPWATTLHYDWLPLRTRKRLEGGRICGGTSGGPNPAATDDFYSFPGGDAVGVPTWQRIGGEIPWHPANVLGIKGIDGYTWGPIIGGAFLLYPRWGRDVEPVSYTVSGPHGLVTSRMLTADTATPTGPAGDFLGGSGILVVPAPLQPLSRYTVAVDWRRTADAEADTPESARQQFSFTTGTGPRAGQYTINPRMTLEAKRKRRMITVRIGAGEAIGRRVQLSFVYGWPPPFQSTERIRLTRERTVVRWRIPRAVWRGLPSFGQRRTVSVKLDATFRKDGNRYTNNMVSNGQWKHLRWRVRR